MKVTIVGNHCTWTRALSTSFLINDELIVDVPQGSFKSLYRDYGLDNIKYILITHFHSDHFADLHLVIDILSRRKGKYVILAPKGCKERLFSIFHAFGVPHLKKPVEEKFEFLECENGKSYSLGKYKIKTYKMIHGSLDAYGYIIDDGRVKVGFSGDTCMCNSLLKIIKKSNAIFIDASKIDENLNHLSVNEVLNLSREYKNTTFYPVHISDATKKLVKDFGLNETSEGQIIYF